MRIPKVTFVVLPILLFVSCSKNIDSKSLWVLSDNQFNVVKTNRLTSNGYFILLAKDGTPSPNTLQIYFASTPTTSKQYKVVPFREGTLLSNEEIGFKVSLIPTVYYYSTGIASMSSWPWIIADKADVTINNQKITIQIPKMHTKVVGPNYDDSLYFRATIIEN